MGAGGRDLERSPGTLLAADVGEVGHGHRRRAAVRLGGSKRRRLGLPRVGTRPPGPGARTGTGSTPASADLGSRVGRADQALETGLARSLRDGERAADRPHAAVERELPEHRMRRQALGRHLVGRGQDRKRDREVEPGALLAQRGRREVDRDAVLRPLPLGGRDPAPNTLLRLLARAVGEADDREAGQPALQVRLDLDPPRIESDDGVGDGPREHAFHARQETRACLCRLCAGRATAATRAGTARPRPDWPASRIARTTASRSAPAATTSAALDSSMPPIANHGSCTVRGRKADEVDARPASRPGFVGVWKTGPTAM